MLIPLWFWFWVGRRDVFLFYLHISIVIVDLFMDESVYYPNDTRGPLTVVLPFPLTRPPILEIIPIGKIKFGHNFHLLSVWGFLFCAHVAWCRRAYLRLWFSFRWAEMGVKSLIKIRQKKPGINPGHFILFVLILVSYVIMKGLRFEE